MTFDFILDSVKCAIEVYKVRLYFKITTKSLESSEFLLWSQCILNLWSTSGDSSFKTHSQPQSSLIIFQYRFGVC